MQSYVPTKIATFIFAGVMAIFGIFHFISGDAMTGAVPSYLPMPIIWVYLTGAALIAYAVSVFMNHKLEKMAGYLLALMLVLFVLMVHLPAMMSGADPKAVISILKDLALAAAAIVMANHADMT
ncbi:MAG: hypothetical protein MUE53_07810 [Chitinophagales bacterium]|jgi:uncharacterized membrane protein|nr:hypothetical protein [Chitinophagales bacterium]